MEKRNHGPKPSLDTFDVMFTYPDTLGALVVGRLWWSAATATTPRRGCSRAPRWRRPRGSLPSMPLLLPSSTSSSSPLLTGGTLQDHDMKSTEARIIFQNCLTGWSIRGELLIRLMSRKTVCWQQIISSSAMWTSYNESWSHWTAKLRDWAVWPVRAGCYSSAALSLIYSKTLYY